MFHASYGLLKTNLPISRQVSSVSQGQEGEIGCVQQYCDVSGENIMLPEPISLRLVL